MLPFISTFLKPLPVKIFTACLVLFVAILLPSYLAMHYPFFENIHHNHLIKAISVGIIVITAIWLLRSKLDKWNPKYIGIKNIPIAIKHMVLGISFILLPLLTTLILAKLFGWAEYSFNLDNSILVVLVLGFISTFFTDALSEELIFRGYIYSNLKQRFGTWKSSLITLVIFVIAPVLLILIQNSLNINSGVPLSGGYVITLMVFGIFMQYLRIIFNSIWVGVGFHLVFVHMNQLMGTTSGTLLQFSETSNQQPVQIALIICLLIVFLCLIAYPFIKSRNKQLV